MNKTERLLAIVLELQRNKVSKAEDLAAKLEISVRTIYRDIQALSEAGVPIIGATGVGYSLMEGYFLPPVTFTVEEAVALLIGSDFIEQRFDHHYSRNARTSRGKIEAILPQPVRDKVDWVRNSMRLIDSAQSEIGMQVKAYVQKIRTAILDGRKIRFQYHKKFPELNGRYDSVRTVSPYGLVFVQGDWTLIAYCDLRENIRHFRVSRMSDLTITDETFQTHDDFNLHDYQPKDDRTILIRALFNTSIADKVKQTNNYYMEDAELHADGYYVNFRVRQPEELLNWILGWGADVVIIEPASFKARVRDEIEKMIKRY